MIGGIAIEPKHLDIIAPLLARHLPPRTQVFAYGSRATGKGIWRGSDLDLMVRADQALPLGVLGDLGEDLSESLLPFMVDLHDWHRTTPDFLARIAPDLVALPTRAACV